MRIRILLAAVVAAGALCATAALAVLAPAASAEECPNAAFRTGPSSHLPDCRAYEMVSPPYKDAGLVQALVIGPDGSSALLHANAGFGEIEGFPDANVTGPEAFYSTRRTASGWVSTPDNLPVSEYVPYLSLGFTDYTGSSQDGQATLFMDHGVWQPAESIDLIMRRPDRSIVDVGPALPPVQTAPYAAVDAFGGGISVDASHIFFTMFADFWPFDDTNKGDVSLYEYIGYGNTTPLLVGVDSEGKQISRCGTTLGGGSSQNAVSTDGSTVFFTADACGGSLPVAEVFARIDNGLPGARTVAISEPSKEDCLGCDTEPGVLAAGSFEGASEDGTKAFFTTTQPLLGGDTSENLYEYDLDAPTGERVVRVSAGDSTVSNLVAGVHSVTAISNDGSHVYFTATGALTSTPNGEGEVAESNAENLYVYERDAQFPSGRIAFVAKNAGLREADVTPDGRFLVFTSSADLTPDDTSTARQVFEYDAQTGALVRVSIGQDGFNHNGNVAVTVNPDPPHEAYDDASIVSPHYSVGSYDSAAYWSRLSVSADGSYVFFQSPVGLTPQALNQQLIDVETGEDNISKSTYANNVYEYHEGRVSLLSDGQDLTHRGQEVNVELIGSDPSGDDLFFTTADRLVGQDTDTSIDVYDARINGGFSAPAIPPSCSGDACQGQLNSAPTLLSPGSEFQAGGNPPLAGEPAPVPVPKKKPKATKKSKKRKRAGKKSGKAHARPGAKAKGAAVGGRMNGKAGRS